ncbi:MAG TPA: flavodoxin domain-containing protein [Thermoleophilia bacterium]|nr:flavodoxin domain-containing protein [Thermoleophilia bacterium]
MTQVLVAYGTRYGSTREVAETVASTLRESGVETELKAAGEVRSLDGYAGVVVGTPLYLGVLHKDVRALLEKNGAALADRPVAVFALGPIKAGDGVDGSREQLFTALAKLPAPTPVSTAVFVGAYDPSRLGFRDRMLAALPASPLHGEPAHDDRDWEAIREWAREVRCRLR